MLLFAINAHIYKTIQRGYSLPAFCIFYKKKNVRPHTTHSLKLVFLPTINKSASKSDKPQALKPTRKSDQAS